MLYRTDETKNKYLIAFDDIHVPYAFDNINEWVLMSYLLGESYTIETPLINDDNQVKWCYDEYKKLCENFNGKFLVDYIICSNKFAQLIPKDNSELFNQYLKDNIDIVKQYKNGNLKAINQLLGKILKDNKSFDPKQLKMDLENLLSDYKI